MRTFAVRSDRIGLTDGKSTPARRAMANAENRAVWLETAGVE